jgi:1-acyl-sn-glycerol-3-phosphate acyltransferase
MIGSTSAIGARSHAAARLHKAPPTAPANVLSRLMRPLVHSLDTTLAQQRRTDPFRRDPTLLREIVPLLKALNSYFATEVRGWENLPAHGPFLIVGNHSGGAESNDFWFFLETWLERRGADAPLYGLGYDVLFAYPGVGPLLRRIGIIPANHANAGRALARGAAVVVFPGGDHEVFRPWSKRNRIDFGGRKGFIELAISTGVPVVPMTIHGAHQSTLTLTRGRWLAHLMGMDRLHVKVFPLIWSIPFGPAPAFVPSVQLPSKVTVVLGKPFRWHYLARRARDPEVRQHCYDQITGTMQVTMDALSREHRYPVLDRLSSFLPHPATRMPSQ